MSPTPDVPAVVRVRPRSDLLRTAAITALLVTSPMFAILYWFTVPRGTWLQVLVPHVLVLFACVLVGVRQLTVFTEVRGGRLRGNGIFSPIEEVELARIARVDLVETYVGLIPSPVRQLLVRDADGRRLFRMRGNFWPAGDLDAIADALPVTPIKVTEPIDLRDFFRAYPGSAYWFENRRAVIVVAVALGGLIIVGITAGMIALVGEHPAL
jgi:hypothetical protein